MLIPHSEHNYILIIVFLWFILLCSDVMEKVYYSEGIETVRVP